MKNILVSMLIAALFAGCGSDKKYESQATGEDTILAVRTVESNGNNAEGLTEVALLSGNLENPEAAQMAAENATWVPISNF